MSANTLTNLIPDIIESMDIVCREQIGFIPAVMRSSSAERAALNDVIRWPVTTKKTPGSISPAYIGPDAAGEDVSGGPTLSITKSYAVPFVWNGEETKGGVNAGFYRQMFMQEIQQAMRGLANAVEADLAALYIYASRACKTTGLKLFDDTDGTESLALLLQILKDNGAAGDLQLVLGSSGAARMRSARNLFKVNEAGNDALLRRGELGNLLGFGIHESGQIAKHTNGTYAAAVATDNALGGTALTTTGCTAAVIKAGDLLKIAGDDENVYVSQKVGTDAGTLLTLNKPGLKVARVGQTDAITPLIGTSYIPNMAFSREAIALITRTPAMPEGGDAATDSYIVTDPVSGLAMEVRKYSQYHQNSWEVGLAWGCAAVKSEMIALLAQ